MLRFRCCTPSISSSSFVAASSFLSNAARSAVSSPSPSSAAAAPAAAAETQVRQQEQPQSATTSSATAKPSEQQQEMDHKRKVDEMHAKYAPEGQASDAMGTLTVDEAARLGYVGRKYHGGLVRDLLPAVTLPTALLALGGAAFYFPEVMLTYEAGAAAAAGLVAMQRLLLRGFGKAQPVDLRGKVAVVTGASSNGVGRQVAAALVAAGAEVIISHKSTSSHDAVAGVVKAADKKWRHFVPKGQEKAATAEEFEKRIVAWPLTLEDRLSVVKFASVVRQKFPGGVDIFVQCAGSTPDFGDLIITKNGYEHHIDSNFIGVWQLTEALLPGMKKRQMLQGDAAATIPEKKSEKGSSSTSSNSNASSTASNGSAGTAGTAAAGNGAGRVVFVIHPGSTLVRGKNLITEFFAPVHLVDDWRFNNSIQQVFSHFGLVCGMHNLVQRGVSSVCVYPGRVASMYRRTVAPTSTTLWRPLLLATVQRTPYEAAQSVVFSATGQEVPRLTPTYVSDCKVRSHWKSRTCYDEKKMAGVVAWAQMQLKTAASSAKAAAAAAVNKSHASSSSSSSSASPTGQKKKQ